MSKRIILFLALVNSMFFSYTYVFASAIEADSRINAVTVYPDSAVINRVAAVKLDAGANQVIFSNIIPEVDEDSLRVSGVDSEEVKILDVQLKKEFLKEEAAEKVKKLKEEIQKAQDEVKKIENNRKILNEEKNFLDSIRLFSHDQVPKDLVTRMPVAKDLDETYKFLDLKLRENYAQDTEMELQMRELQKKIDMLSRELADISGPRQKLKRSILVDVQAQGPKTVSLSVSYLVRGASWQPLYDARADFEKTKVELVSYGIIKQVTGEDWQDVEISLSTAKPSIGGNMPYVAPWVLRPYQPRVLKMKNAGSGFARQRAAFEEEKADLMDLAAPSVPYAQAEEKGIAVVYKLPNKASIKSDGSEQKLPVSSQILNADFKYSAYPRAVLMAYLGSRVTNGPNLQLLGGRVNIFLSGDFVGTSTIENIGPGEEFDLYLGADENVKVKREQIEKKVDETIIGNIPSPNKKTTFTYKLKAENYKNKKIYLKLFETMPVSEDDRIKAKIVNVSPEPKEKDWKDRKGVWLWELELNPKEKKEITYTFIVEHPRDMNVEGL